MGLASFRRLIRSRHLAWLLALALWLPAAQWAAATHALLHLHAAVSNDVEQPGHLPDSCDTCVVAAAFLGAAPGVEFTPPPLPPRPPQAQPQAGTPAFHPQASAAAYRSRAPPLPHA